MAFITQLTLKLLTLILVCTSLAYAESPAMQLKMSVVKEIDTINAKGQPITQYAEPVNVIPGDQIIYITQYNNTSTTPIYNALITNPIPKHLLYLESTTNQDHITTTYSIDHGNTFSPANQLNITQDDGTQRLATAQDYTHIRWTISSIAPGEHGQVQFKAQVK